MKLTEEIKVKIKNAKSEEEKKTITIIGRTLKQGLKYGINR